MSESFNDAMEYIWERIPKTPEGLIHYLATDLPYLYFNGFVDTQQFSLEQWLDALKDCLQADGTYLVAREKFLSLRVFRYTGPVFKPFDPYKLREGPWSDEDLKKLFDLSIKPSSSITEEIFINGIKSLKAQGFVQDGQLVINEAVKKRFAYLLEEFPSPRRQLEKEMDRFQQEREQEFRAVTKNRDSSKFVSGKLDSESKLEKLSALQSKSASKPQATKTTPKTKTEEIDIKKLRKPTRKIKG